MRAHTSRRPFLFAPAILAGATFLAACTSTAPPPSVVAVSDDGAELAWPAGHDTVHHPDVAVRGDTIAVIAETGVLEPQPEAMIHGYSSQVALSVSTDAGSTWQQSAVPNPSGATVAAGQVHLGADGAIWVLTDHLVSNVLGTYLHRSTDGGRTWALVRQVSGTPSGGISTMTGVACDSSPTSPAAGTCYVHERFSSRFASYGRILASTDQGATWESRTAAPILLYATEIVVRPAGGLVLLGRDGGRIQATTSVDGGRSFAPPVTVGETTGGPTGHGLSVDGAGRLVAAWAGCPPEQASCTNRDVFVATSGDGAAWSVPVVVPRLPHERSEDRTHADVVARPTAEGTAGFAVGFLATPAGCTDACTVASKAALTVDSGVTWSARSLTQATPVDWFGRDHAGQRILAGPALAATTDRVVAAFPDALEPEAAAGPDGYHVTVRVPAAPHLRWPG